MDGDEGSKSDLEAKQTMGHEKVLNVISRGTFFWSNGENGPRFAVVEPIGNDRSIRSIKSFISARVY